MTMPDMQPSEIDRICEIVGLNPMDLTDTEKSQIDGIFRRAVTRGKIEELATTCLAGVGGLTAEQRKKLGGDSHGTN